MGCVYGCGGGTGGRFKEEEGGVVSGVRRRGVENEMCLGDVGCGVGESFLRARDSLALFLSPDLSVKHFVLAF